jgi:ABC-2 type transport system ATP-binding protein
MTKALSIQNLTKTYANGTVALKGISFDVEEGDFFALLGPNGAGKSTTIGIVSDLVKKTQGTVKIFGADISREPSRAKVQLGLVPQEFNFGIFEKVVNILIHQAGYYGISASAAAPRIEKYLTALGLWDKRDQPARFLSGGMKRRLMIARALIHQPKLLILDEPTAGVDIELRRLLWDFLKTINQEGITVILTTHYLEEAEHLCRNIGIIHQGELIEHGSMKMLLQKLLVETFIFYLSEPIYFLPNIDLPCRLVDDTTIEVDLQEGQTLTEIIQRLFTAGIKVKTMRNKTNRLEELFLRLTTNGKA